MYKHLHSTQNFVKVFGISLYLRTYTQKHTLDKKKKLTFMTCY